MEGKGTGVDFQGAIENVSLLAAKGAGMEKSFFSEGGDLCGSEILEFLRAGGSLSFKSARFARVRVKIKKEKGDGV